MALAAAFAVAVGWRIHQWRLQPRPRYPNLSLEQAWTLWLEGEETHPDLSLAPSGTNWRQPNERAAEIMQGRLASISERLDASTFRSETRTAVLQAASSAVYLEAALAMEESDRPAVLQGYQAGMEPLLIDALRCATLEWLVLRLYARLRFDDAVPEDWFHHFLQVARPYAREKARLAAVWMLRLQEDASEFVRVYDQLLEELAQRMAQSAPKKRFPPPDLPQSLVRLDRLP